MFSKFPFIIIVMLILGTGIFSCRDSQNKKNGNNNFVTWENPCFDRCASIWLIENFVDSTATFRFTEFQTT